MCTARVAGLTGLKWFPITRQIYLRQVNGLGRWVCPPTGQALTEELFTIARWYTDFSCISDSDSLQLNSFKPSLC